MGILSKLNMQFEVIVISGGFGDGFGTSTKTNSYFSVRPKKVRERKTFK